MTGYAIRVAGIPDLPTIMPVMHMAFDPQFGEAWTELQCIGVLVTPGSRLLVVEESGSPVGFALSRVIIDECELMLLAVAPSAQRRGIGRALLDQVVADARTQGANSIFLEVRDGNIALTLYSSAGFSQVGRRHAYYRGRTGQIHDALTYRSDLT
jgi:[ribosomal protein S18]-alanine N-acetyltransferase